MDNNYEELTRRAKNNLARIRNTRIDQAVLFDGLDFSLALEMYNSDMSLEEVKAVLDSGKVSEVNRLAIRLLNGKWK